MIMFLTAATISTWETIGLICSLAGSVVSLGGVVYRAAKNDNE